MEDKSGREKFKVVNTVKLPNVKLYTHRLLNIQANVIATTDDRQLTDWEAI